MGDQDVDHASGMDMTSSDIVFDNLTILKEFSNIVNIVKNEEFLETFPKAMKRVNWALMFNFLKQYILDLMIQELNDMWKYENIPEKLEILDKQKEKFNNMDAKLWRPQLNDVKSQLRAHDFVNLQKQKALLETLAKEYETKVDRLKKTLSAKRGYLKVLQMDIQKYQKKNEEFIHQINEKIENHNNLTKVIRPMKIDVDNIKWSDGDLEIN